MATKKTIKKEVKAVDAKTIKEPVKVVRPIKPVKPIHIAGGKVGCHMESRRVRVNGKMVIRNIHGGKTMHEVLVRIEGLRPVLLKKEFDNVTGIASLRTALDKFSDKLVEKSVSTK